MFAHVMMVVVSALQGDSVFCYHAFISGRFGSHVMFSRPCCAAERLSASSGDSNVIQALTNTFLLTANCCPALTNSRGSLVWSVEMCYNLEGAGIVDIYLRKVWEYGHSFNLGVLRNFQEQLNWSRNQNECVKISDIGVQGFHSSISFSFSLMNGEFLIKVSFTCFNGGISNLFLFIMNWSIANYHLKLN